MPIPVIEDAQTLTAHNRLLAAISLPAMYGPLRTATIRRKRQGCDVDS